MTLASLHAYDRVTAANILAAAALLAAPNPGLGNTAFQNSYLEPAQAVLAEVRGRLAASGKRRKDTPTLSSALSREIQALVLPDEAEDRALERAGQAGRLIPSIYKVVLSKQFRSTFGPLGVSRHAADTTVRHPDDYQHLMTEVAVEHARDTLSLFMKLMRPNDGTEGYWLLVQTVRQGIEQHCHSAWRVYASDVDLDSAETPLDVLRAFVDVFGLPIDFAGEQAKFIEGRDFPVFDGRVQFEVGGDILPGVATHLSISHVPTVNPTVARVGVGYMINLTRYGEALKRHGAIRV